MKTVRQELGYKEKSGQFTKFGQWYADRVQDAQYRNAPWCDMFLAWAADKAGVTDYVGEFAWTPSHAAWFIQQGAWSRKPEPGALVFYDWSGGKSYKGIDHVGVVERVEGKKIHTIEANVDRVWLKRKTRETDKVVGYGLPRVVKANADKLAEIRATERPFDPGPRVENGRGSPLDVLGTPPALLAAMVLVTIVLSLRVTGRRRGVHRRFTWPWRKPPVDPQPGRRSPLPPANPFSEQAGQGDKPGAREKVLLREKPQPRDPAQPREPDQPREPASPRAVAVPEQPRPARTRVPAGSARTAAGRPTPKRRKPYEED
ncbi:CHAP domain-containing protein [Nonomuraea purpurea]|uniref:CHAP domain-containing protein n=1 Tax=Nonomuraea purpurea TaxID=1849276 RepID=A0ABV8GFD7_9ACTN